MIYGSDLAYIHDCGFSAYAEGCAPGLLNCLKQFSGCKKVVDLGCGSGVWAEHLVAAGFDVVGFDCSTAMITMANRRVPTAEFQTGSLWELPLPKCHAVTALGEVLCYRPLEDGRQELSTMFRRIYSALESGGIAIFDVAEVGLDRERQPTFIEGNDWACLVSFEYDASHDRLHRKITTFRQVEQLYRRSFEEHVLQLYRAEEVESRLRDAGFRVDVVRNFGAFPLLPQRVGFIARRP